MRGIAALSVLLLHVGYIAGRSWLAPLGYLAVDLFWVISGFVIAHAYERPLLTGMTWRTFMAFRLARLYPSLLLGVAVGALARVTVLPHAQPLGWRAAGHLLLIPDLSGAAIFPLNGVLWTLFFELVANAVHARAVRLITIGRLAIFSGASGVLWFLAASKTQNWGGGWDRASFLSGFARVGWSYSVGVLLHRLVTARVWKPPAVPWLVPITGVALLLLVPGFASHEVRIVATVYVLSPLLVALAIEARNSSGPTRVAAWLGRISYPLYVLHFPLITLAARGEPVQRPLAWCAAVAAAIVAIAAVVESTYDAPLRTAVRRALLRRVARRGGGGPRPHGAER